MSALVLELVDMASTPGVSTADLLRRSLVVARRLAVPELVGWINSELTGYRSGEVPDYRRLHGQLMAENPREGRIPFFTPPNIDELVTNFSVRQSIPELQHLFESSSEMFSYFPRDVEQTLMSMVQKSTGTTMKPVLKFSSVQIRGVVETVRSRILDWALDLEGRGILGAGQTFTLQEKQAVQAQHYHFGDVSGSQIQIGSSGSSQSQTSSVSTTDLVALESLIAALAEVLECGRVKEDVANELRAELSTLRAQAASPKPKWEIIKMTARTIIVVAEGAAGNIQGELAKPHFQTLVTLAAGSVGGAM